MKSFVMSMFLLTTAFGAALSIALSSVSVDPKLVWMYSGISVAAFIAGWVFWILFKHYNYQEDKMNAMESKDPQKVINVTEIGQHRRNVEIGAPETVATERRLFKLYFMYRLVAMKLCRLSSSNVQFLELTCQQSH